MLEVNSMNVTGRVITSPQKTERGIEFVIGQKVGNAMPTRFNIVSKVITLDIDKGDKILIMRATAYEKENQFFFKILEKDQIFILEKKLNHGTMEVDEFI